MKQRIDDLMKVMRTRSEAERSSVWQGFIHGLRQMCTREELAYLEDQIALLHRDERLEKWDAQFMEATINVQAYVQAKQPVGSSMYSGGGLTLSANPMMNAAQQRAIDMQTAASNAYVPASPLVLGTVYQTNKIGG